MGVGLRPPPKLGLQIVGFVGCVQYARTRFLDFRFPACVPCGTHPTLAELYLLNFKSHWIHVVTLNFDLSVVVVLIEFASVVSVIPYLEVI